MLVEGPDASGLHVAPYHHDRSAAVMRYEDAVTGQTATTGRLNGWFYRVAHVVVSAANVRDAGAVNDLTRFVCVAGWP